MAFHLAEEGLDFGVLNADYSEKVSFIDISLNKPPLSLPERFKDSLSCLP